MTGPTASTARPRRPGGCVLVPAMPDDSALVDLDALTRGAAITRDSRLEVWMEDDPELVAAVQAGAGASATSPLTDVRRYADDPAGPTTTPSPAGASRSVPRSRRR